VEGIDLAILAAVLVVVTWAASAGMAWDAVRYDAGEIGVFESYVGVAAAA
jgi:hypothetical protein